MDNFVTLHKHYRTGRVSMLNFPTLAEAIAFGNNAEDGSFVREAHTSDGGVHAEVATDGITRAFGRLVAVREGGGWRRF